MTYFIIAATREDYVRTCRRLQLPIGVRVGCTTVHFTDASKCRGWILHPEQIILGDGWERVWTDEWVLPVVCYFSRGNPVGASYVILVKGL